METPLLVRLKLGTEYRLKLGVDYVVLRGSGERDVYNGATVKSSKYTHLGLLLDNQTACGGLIESFLATYSEVRIDCPECIKAIKTRGTVPSPRQG